jgi:maltose O-acetyltransferase
MKYYFVNIILRILPSSRFFRLKRLLLTYIGATIGENVRVMRIKVEGVKLRIGENTFIGDETLITGGDSIVSIGSNCDISSRVSIVTGTHKIGDKEKAAGEGYSEDIIIEDGVWIGFGAIILHGVTIGKGSIIGAGAVVNSNIPSGVLAIGIPAKIKKHLNPI